MRNKDSYNKKKVKLKIDILILFLFRTFNKSLNLYNLHLSKDFFLFPSFNGLWLRYTQAGLKPARSRSRILSPLCLPIPPPGLISRSPEYMIAYLFFAATAMLAFYKAFFEPQSKIFDEDK